MAEAPKSTKKDKAADPKAKTSEASAKLSGDAKGPIEDAEVIGETPPQARAASGAADKVAAKDLPEDSMPATPTSSRAKPKTSSRKAPAAETAVQPAETSVEKPAEKPMPAQSETRPEPAAVKSEVKSSMPERPATTRAETPPPPPKSPAPPAPPPRKSGSGGFLGLLLGGVAAAIVGFVAARTVVPEGWPFPGVEPAEDPLVGVVEAQGAEIATLGDRLGALDAALEEVRSDTSALDELRDSVAARLDGLESGASEIATQLGTMETRLSSVEKLAPEGTEAAKVAAEAYAKELAALREMFAGELEEIDAAQAEASALEAQLAESAKAAAGRAALAQVDAALDTGEPFADSLLDLTEATGVAAPEALSAVAAEGVPTLSELQASFPAAARAAIDADIRTSVEDGSMNRMQAFLQTQLGTRSLEPKEGDSADAVLSRAEAALKSGDLDTVLTEIDTLPEAAKPAFSEWRVLTETRAAALAAGKALAEELNAK